MCARNKIVISPSSFNSTTISIAIRCGGSGYYTFGRSFVQVRQIKVIVAIQSVLMSFDSLILVVEHLECALSFPY